MEFKRKRARIVVDVSVTLTTVLDSVEARIIDLSEHGAQIVGAALPKNSKFQIEYQGQTIYAQCMWSEIDRMGVRFPFVMTDGPLHDILAMAMPASHRHSDETGVLARPAAGGYMAVSTMDQNSASLSGRRPMPTSFGRRPTS
ncbi:PilZ domain-containing protein [Sphingobium sufflavum]|uniref:PilZ domain-containing protein n=1 Tax=Sphingobium sufflavum TaxID=1129547 RepID=UPI001F423CB4|nr:PilZ domain-containing protein [Sphingobium sufflavum]MCE7798809.1 PilZ domain-containing protein [Sphingobium sufflavum]